MFVICISCMDSGQSQYGMKKISYGCLSKLSCLLWLQHYCLGGTMARETQGAMLLRPWIEAGLEYSGSRAPWLVRPVSDAKNRECRTEAAVQVYQDYCLFNKVLFSPPIYFIKLSVHVWSNTSLLSQVYAYRIFWKSLNLKHESFCITQYPTVGIIYMRNFSWEKKTLNFPFY